jgi:patatin-like phospholipase/acyl hydrolase
MAFKLAVLSIDGGGIKGIVPAMILAEIEKRTEKRTYELFDMIAGTSTGGILTLGLTKPKGNGNKPEFKAEDLVKLYTDQGQKIFKIMEDKKLNSLGLKPLAKASEILLKKFNINMNLENLFSSKYTRREKVNVLDELLGKTPLCKALSEVIITSYSTNLRMPIFFTSNSEKERLNSEYFCKLCSGYQMKDAAMATSAAPTYFKAYHLHAPNNKAGSYTLIDGGIIANNPTSIAIVEAMESYKMKVHDKGVPLSEILVVSLGTGTAIRKFSREIEEWGLIKWIEPLISMVFSGQSEVIDYQMEHLLSNEQYYRFQPVYQANEAKGGKKHEYLSQHIIHVNDDMDDASRDNICNLKKAAEIFIETQDKKLESLCKQLTDALNTRELIKKK